MFDPKLCLVETIEDVATFLEWLQLHRAVLGVDTETTGLEWWQPNFLRTVQFGDAERGFTLPVTWWYKIIKNAIESYKGPIVFHNAKFDIHALRSADIEPPISQVHDTKIMAHIIDPMANNSLKPLSRKYVDPGAQLGQDLLKMGMQKNGWTWATVPLDWPIYWSYGALDTCITAVLFEKLQFLVERDDLQNVYDMEMQVQNIMTEAEQRGATIDLQYTSDLYEKWQIEMADLLIKIEALGVTNPNASKQIEAALRLEGWEPVDFTAKGNIRLDEGVLRGLDYEVVQLILDYKKLRKWSTAYLQQFLNRADGDKLHADINTLKARTGRMSITKPALQTLPRGPEIRDCIVASPGRHLLAIDYSQIEYRLFAIFAQERLMIEELQKPETDFHSITASIIFGPGYTKQQRSLSKNCNFAWLYGAGPAKLAKTANKDEHVIDEDQARAILNQYKNTFPGAAAFMKQVEQVARQREREEGRPYIYTPKGRKLYAEKDKNYALVNFLCQGTAAEVLKEKLVALDMAGLTEYLILPVHDELIFDIPDDLWEEQAKEISNIMQDLTTFSVPLTVTVSKPLERWGDSYRMEEK